MPPDGTILQLVPVPDVREKPMRLNVSLRKSTLGMIDRKAKLAGMTRSGFLSKAAEACRVAEQSAPPAGGERRGIQSLPRKSS
jgi:hypothetical protein